MRSGKIQWGRACFFWMTTYVLSVAASFIIIFHAEGLFSIPDFETISSIPHTSVLFSADGTRIKEFCEHCREIIPLQKMGWFPKVAVAAEDKNFWIRKTPFDFLAIARATLRNLKERGIKEGASTLTMQAVKLYALQEELARQRRMPEGYQKTIVRWKRKLREIYLAPIFEHRYARRDILDYYLNTVPCGDNHYGVESCSWMFFGKGASDLDVAETAAIVGCFPSPKYCPFHNSKKILERRDLTIKRVLEYQYIHGENIITGKDLRRFKKRPLPTAPKHDSCRALHFAEFIRLQLIETGTHVTDKGLAIWTHLDCVVQREASRALEKSIKAIQERNPVLTDLEGAVVILDHSGAIKAFAQYPPFGKTEGKSEFLLNNIERHCGSTCKIFFYTVWLEKGGRLSCNDEGGGPCRLNDHPGIKIHMGGKEYKKIQNFPYQGIARYQGMTEPIECIAESRNACTMSGMKGVKNAGAPQLVSKEDILALLGRLKIPLRTIDPLVASQRGIGLIDPDFAKEQGLPRNTIDPGLTVAIGSLNVSPLNMARAMGELIHGKSITAYGISKITDTTKMVLFQQPEKIPYIPVLEEKISKAITRGLRAPVEFPHGTAKRARQELHFQIACKTGTSTNIKGETNNNWVICATPSYSASVWIGRKNENLPIISYDKTGKEIQETGGKNALPIAIEAFKMLYQNQPKENFAPETDPQKPFRTLPTNIEAGIIKEAQKEKVLKNSQENGPLGIVELEELLPSEE